MRPKRQDGTSVWSRWTRKLTVTATVSVASVGFLADPATVRGQSGNNRFVSHPQPVSTTAAPNSAFGKTVQQLMQQSRREAAAGNLDAAIRTAHRAKKIAEAASSVLGASPDCSPAAADQLYREILALRPEPSPERTTSLAASPSVAPVDTKERAPAPQTPIVSGPTATVWEGRRTVEGERWRPQSSSADNLSAPIVAKVIAEPQPAPMDEEVYFPLDAAPSEAVSPEAIPTKQRVAERSSETAAPATTELGLASTLNIVGGARTAKFSLRPRHTLPIHEPLIADPDWTRADSPIDSDSTMTHGTEGDASWGNDEAAREQPEVVANIDRTAPTLSMRTPTAAPRSPDEVAAFVEMTTLPPNSEWVTPPTLEEPVRAAGAIPSPLNPVTDWSASGAVVRKQRIGRAASLSADGWQSPADAVAHVTRAVGSANDQSSAGASESVATTAFRSTTVIERNEFPPVAEDTLFQAPLPPQEVDEDEVALQAPSVWKREGLASVTQAEPSTRVPSSPAWQHFSEWSQARGWTATSAAIGLAAAVLALAAFALAMIPRTRRTVK